MAFRKVVNRDKWGHIRRAVNPAYIPTRVCDVKDVDRWFRGPVFLFQIEFKFEGFDATERLELVEDLVNIEAKGKEKGKLSLTSCAIGSQHSTSCECCDD